MEHFATVIRVNAFSPVIWEAGAVTEGGVPSPAGSPIRYWRKRAEDIRTRQSV